MQEAQRKLVYHMAISVDGCIARKDGRFDFFPTEGDHIADYIAHLQSYGAVVMGKNTYDLGLQQGVSDPYPWLDTYVVSKTLGKSPNERVKVWSGSPAALVSELKAQAGKPVYLCGGAQLAAAMFEQGLVDELILKVNPVLLGGGIPLVAPLPRHVPLTLSAEKRYQSGVVLLTYQVGR